MNKLQYSIELEKCLIILQKYKKPKFYWFEPRFGQTSFQLVEILSGKGIPRRPENDTILKPISSISIYVIISNHVKTYEV